MLQFFLHSFIGLGIGYLLFVGWDHIDFKEYRYGYSGAIEITVWHLPGAVLFIWMWCPVLSIVFPIIITTLLVVGIYRESFFSNRKILFYQNGSMSYNINDITFNKPARLLKIIKKLRSIEIYNQWFYNDQLDIVYIYGDVSEYHYQDTNKDKCSLNLLGTKDYKLFLRFVTIAYKKQIKYIILDKLV